MSRKINSRKLAFWSRVWNSLFKAQYAHTSGEEVGNEIAAAMQQNLQNSDGTAPEAQQERGLECRSFWKAGNYAVGDTFRPVSSDGMLSLNPSFIFLDQIGLNAWLVMILSPIYICSM